MTVASTATPQNQPKLGLVSKLLPLWIILAMVIGLLLGKFLPQVGKALQPGIPIGLDLGGPTPEEIAVAILAEVIAVRRGGKGSSCSRQSS